MTNIRFLALAAALLAPALAQPLPAPDQSPTPAPPDLAAPAARVEIPVRPALPAVSVQPGSETPPAETATPTETPAAEQSPAPDETPAPNESPAPGPYPSPTPELQPPPPGVTRQPEQLEARSRFGGPLQGIFYTGQDEGFGFGSILPDPTAFQGGNRADPVLQGTRFIDTATLTGHYGTRFTPDQRLMLTTSAGLDSFSVDADYSFIPEGTPGYFSAYINHTQSLNSSYRYGRGVGLFGSNDEPYLYRTNAGFGYTSDPRQPLIVSSGLMYERINVHDGAFSSRVAPFDVFGNPLTLNSGGTDQRLLLRVNGLYMDLDDIQFPTRGDKLRFFAHQTMGLGATPGGMTQLGVNYTRFQRIGDPTLIFNVQAGHSLGTVAPYDAFNMGGTQSVRGFQLGELGGGSSFLQSTVELRVPIGEMTIFGTEIPFRFATFVDYGTAFGTQDLVYGQPAVVRNKLDSAFGYGAGVQAVTNFGLVRVEAAFAQGGRSLITLTVGDRY